MALATRIRGSIAVIMCDAAVDQMETGSGTAKLQIYDGTQPAGPDTAITSQVKLAEISLPDPAFGNASDAGAYAEATLNGVPLSDTSADNTGTASWFRVVNENNDALFDGSVGTGTHDMVIDNTSIASGQTVRLNSYAFRVPKS